MLSILRDQTLVNKGLVFLVLLFVLSCDFEELEPEDGDNGELSTVDFSPFIELGTLGGTVSFANAIGNQGYVVGAANTENGERLAFEASDEMRVGIPTSEFTASEFLDIENQYLKVGFGENSQGFNRPLIKFNEDQIVELEMGDQGDSGGEAMAVGNGYVAGIGAVPSVGRYLPVLWEADPSGAIFQCLDSTDLYGINQIYYSGYVDAMSTTVILASDNDTRITSNGTGFIWEAPNKWTALSTTEYPNIIPRDINNSAQIAVTAYDASGNNFPAIYQDGEIILLELPEGFTNGNANSINDIGEVVGSASSNLEVTPIFWDSSGQPTNLNDLLDLSSEELDELGYDPYIISAVDINENGDITGEGYFNLNIIDDGEFTDRQREAYLLPAGSY